MFATKQSLAAPEYEAPPTRTCSQCGGKGHDRRTCPELDAKAAVRRRQHQSYVARKVRASRPCEPFPAAFSKPSMSRVSVPVFALDTIALHVWRAKFMPSDCVQQVAYAVLRLPMSVPTGTDQHAPVQSRPEAYNTVMNISRL